MSFLLVVPRFVRRPGMHYHFPIGLGYISSVLKKKGFEVACLNLNHSDCSVDDLLRQAIVKYDVEVICTGALAPHYRLVKEILEAARRIKPDMVSVIGGGLVTCEPSLVMRGLQADFGVIGEGEETIAELADALVRKESCEGVAGVILKQSDGTYLVTEPRDCIKDIDSLPFPDYAGFEMDAFLDMQLPNFHFNTYPYDKPRSASIIASRSCPFKCTFCYHPLGNAYRQRSPENIFAEIDMLIEKYNINMISLSDELFVSAHNASRAYAFCDRMKERGLLWSAAMRVDGINRELLSRVKDAGCYYIGYGFESASNTVLKSMRKQITVQQIAKAVELTQKQHIGMQGNFIFGDSAETVDTAQETLDWWMKNRRYQINLAMLHAYPSSVIYQRAVESGLIKDRLAFIEEGCKPVNVSRMSDEEYDRLIEVIWDKYIDKYQQVPAKLISCGFLRVDRYQRALYEITVECPHCMSVVTYKNMHHNPDFQSSHKRLKLACRRCNQRFDIPSLKLLFPLPVVRTARPCRLGIWGAGGHTKTLLSAPSFDKKKVGVIFDSDVKKHGTQIEGIEVAPLDPDPAVVKKTIDAILICSPAFEDEIYRQIAYLEDHDVEIHRYSDL